MIDLVIKVVKWILFGVLFKECVVVLFFWMVCSNCLKGEMVRCCKKM